MKKLEIKKDYFIPVTEAKSDNGKDIRIYKARVVMDAPFEAVQYFIERAKETDIWDISEDGGLHNTSVTYDKGCYEATGVMIVTDHDVEVYLTTIIRRPFTEEQYNKYNRLYAGSLQDMLDHPYDSITDYGTMEEP